MAKNRFKINQKSLKCDHFFFFDISATAAFLQVFALIYVDLFDFYASF